MGFSIVFYMRSLFSMVSSDCLPMSQYIWLNLMPSCFLLAKICVGHVSHLSRRRPKYLIDSLCGMRVPFNSIEGHVPCFKVKVICTDVVSLTLILHCCSHSAYWSK
jgi:hypothetical protein